MKDEKFMRDIPDVLEGEYDEDTIKLHSQLKLRVGDLQRRRQQVFEKDGLLLPTDGMEKVRLNLLIQHGLGIDTPARLAFELAWVEVYGENIEHALSERQQQMRDQHLFLPDGQVKRVRDNGTEPPS